MEQLLCILRLLQSSALRDITTTPAPTAASAAPREPTRWSLVRTTVSPALETPPRTLTAPPTSCSAKVRTFPRGRFQWNQTLFDPFVSSHRPTVWRRAGRFHRLHRVPQLPGKLPRQRGVHVDHQPTPQTQDPHRRSRNLPAY